MKNHTKNRISFGAALSFCIVPLIMTGCGGSGSVDSSITTPNPTSGVTRAIVKVRTDFTAAGGGVPVAAQSVVVKVKQGATVVAQTTLLRPASAAGIVEYNFTNLPYGSYTVTTDAYASASASGAVLAQGSQSVNVQTDRGTTLNLAMQSTNQHNSIQTVLVTGASSSVAVHEIVTLSAVAKNSLGQEIPILPSKWQWTSSNTAVAAVEASGLTVYVVGVSQGKAVIHVTELDTGKSATFEITVYNMRV